MRPPPTLKDWPVMLCGVGDARNATMAAMSVTLLMLKVGIFIRGAHQPERRLAAMATPASQPNTERSPGTADRSCSPGLRTSLSPTYGGLAFLARQNFRRSTTCRLGWLLARRPFGGGDQFVRTVRPSEQRAVPGGGCVLSSVEARRGASWDAAATRFGPATLGLPCI